MSRCLDAERAADGSERGSGALRDSLVRRPWSHAPLGPVSEPERVRCSSMAARVTDLSRGGARERRTCLRGVRRSSRTGRPAGAVTSGSRSRGIGWVRPRRHRPSDRRAGGGRKPPEGERCRPWGRVRPPMAAGERSAWTAGRRRRTRARREPPGERAGPHRSRGHLIRPRACLTSRSTAQASATGPRWPSLSGLITERMVWIARRAPRGPGRGAPCRPGRGRPRPAGR